MEKPIPSFTLRLPPLSTRRVWVGIYSEMTGTVVMIWDHQPIPDRNGEYGYPDTPFASVWINEWEHWFGTVQPFVDAKMIQKNKGIGWVVRGKHLDCRKVIEIDLTASWDECGLIGLTTYADN